ncbi:hypothetical protein HNQ60_005121 [Povalibacter uvarum]|uniref:Uncharacterized protein n=1 Tax=Povalibacter uvarum TaxID=732238 RepID=A0A841HVB6_9GAMM|nr:hypothetical protein [Povalibacter uvarum]MBB6096199.1 hypothetical protein [Povalibacter uvarum]
MSTTVLAAVRWSLYTSDEHQAGTDNEVTCELLRDDAPICIVRLEHGDTERLDRNRQDRVICTFKRPYLITPVNPRLSLGVAGIEYPQGFSGHMKMRLRISGPDRWIKDAIVVEGRIGELFRDSEGGALLVSDDGDPWTDLGTFDKRKVLSTDANEGVSALTLIF